MIQTVILMAGLSCPAIILVNDTATWTEADKITLEKAIVRCGELFPSSPCVKVFRKKEELVYNVTCGVME